jgi:hypothetical protein
MLSSYGYQTESKICSSSDRKIPGPYNVSLPAQQFAEQPFCITDDT